MRRIPKKINKQTKLKLKLIRMRKKLENKSEIRMKKK